VLKRLTVVLELSTGIVTVALCESVNDAVHEPVSMPGVTLNVAIPGERLAVGGVICATKGLLTGTGDGVGFAVQLIEAVIVPLEPVSVTLTAAGVGDAVTSNVIEFGDTTGVGDGEGDGLAVAVAVAVAVGLGLGLGLADALVGVL
jgi:hypothetical protein